METTVASSSDSSPGTDPAPSTVATTTTVPTPVQLPAGLQFGLSPEIPVPFSYGSAITTDGERLVALGRAASADPYEATELQAQITGPDGQSQLVTVDDYAGYQNPPGFGSFRGFYVSSVTHGPTGFVAVGFSNIWDSKNNRRVTARSAAWFSTDAVNWQRFDFRSLVGEVNLQVTDVKAVGAGFVAAGSITSSSGTSDPTSGVVFTSPDGSTWSKGAELASRWSVDVRQVLSVGSRLVVTGVEYACTADAGAMFTFSNGAQIRMWASDDGGSTFTMLDASAGGLIVEPNPAPVDAADCPENVVFETDALYASRARLLTAAGDHLVVWSADGTKAAVSADGTTWTVSDVPDAVPVTTNGQTATESDAALATFDGTRFVLMSDELRRDDSGRQMTAGNQMLGWTSTDGSAWEPLPRARPIVPGTYDSLEALSDGSVLLRRDVQLPGSTSITYERSVAGDLVPWDTCAPAPHANCGFTKLQGIDLAGADLTGIDWRGAELDQVTLNGAVLVGARFDGATVTGSSMAGAKLAGASFVGADLGPAVDLTGADVTGARFIAARVPASIVHSLSFASANVQSARFGTHEGDSFASATFAGIDLSGAQFTGSTAATLDLTGADFTGATVVSTYFSDVDLTGATFADVRSGGSMVIGQNVTCPDGAAPTEGKYGTAACRL